MTPGSITNALRGIGGEFELTRVVGGTGAFVFLAGAVGFEAWNMGKGNSFDLTAWCLAVPGGLGVILGAIAGGAGLKDRQVAAAKATESKTKTDAANAGDGAKRIEEAKVGAATRVADKADDEREAIAEEGKFGA